MVRLLTCAFFAALVLLPAACGKKTWPEPKSEQDRFGWRQVEGRMDEGCLDITARLSGNWESLRAVTVEYAPLDTGDYCPGCPFRPAGQATYEQGMTGFTQDKSRLAVRHCPASAPGERQGRYVFRLLGLNVQRFLAAKASAVRLAE